MQAIDENHPLVQSVLELMKSGKGWYKSFVHDEYIRHTSGLHVDCDYEGKEDLPNVVFSLAGNFYKMRLPRKGFFSLKASVDHPFVAAFLDVDVACRCALVNSQVDTLRSNLEINDHKMP